MIKRLYVIVLAILMVMSLYSCGVKDNTENEVPAEFPVESANDDIQIEEKNDAIIDFDDSDGSTDTTDIIEEVANDDLVMPDDNDIVEVSDAEPVVSENDSSQEESPRPMGGSSYCRIHEFEYHAISMCLCGEVTMEDVEEWQLSIEFDWDNENGCPGTEASIYAFIHHFDIPKEKLIELYNLIGDEYYFNVDLLCDGTAEEAERFYRSFSQELKDDHSRFMVLYRIKFYIAGKMGSETFGEICRSGFNSYSLIELLRMGGTPIEIVKDDSRILAEMLGKSNRQFDYDYEWYESLTEEEIDNLIKEHTPFYLDCLFCGITPYDTRYERQVAYNEEYGIFEKN